jgi:hypothetical protein
MINALVVGIIMSFCCLPLNFALYKLNTVYTSENSLQTDHNVTAQKHVALF